MWEEKWGSNGKSPSVNAVFLYRTIIASCFIDSALLVNPRLDVHVVGDERRDRAFQDRRIAANNVLFNDFGVVKLINRCKRVMDPKALTKSQMENKIKLKRGVECAEKIDGIAWIIKLIARSPGFQFGWPLVASQLRSTIRKCIAVILTVVVVREELVPLFIDPRFDFHEIRYERRNGALQDARIALNHVLHQNIGSVILVHNCQFSKSNVTIISMKWIEDWAAMSSDGKMCSLDQFN